MYFDKAAQIESFSKQISVVHLPEIVLSNAALSSVGVIVGLAMSECSSVTAY